MLDGMWVYLLSTVVSDILGQSEVSKSIVACIIE